MTVILAGATLERTPGPKYLEALRFAELAFHSSLPRAATLKTFRDKTPNLELSIVAPRPVLVGRSGELAMDAALNDAIGWYEDVLAAGNAHAVIPTGVGLATGVKDRDRLKAFFERLRVPEGRMKIWAPGGLWDADNAYPLAEEMGVVCACDPLQDEPPDGDVLYARLRAIGARQRFGEGLLVDLLETIAESEPEKVYIAIESERSFREASMLQQLLDDE